ncbi:MAG: hypothetical protein P4L38_12885 [Syntrophaceae bacterium]|nr:hypothetical protein [Syntrophaceae bacterium]
MPKKKLAVYTATGCAACENTILDIHYDLGSLTRSADIVFWPYVLGSQWDGLNEQGPVDVCFFAGAIRTEADRIAAVRLRSNSKLMVACGACAAFGGLPSLTDLHPETPENRPEHLDEGNEFLLPKLESRVFALEHIVDVDYFVPGCPPTRDFLWAAIQSLVYMGDSPTRISFTASRLPMALAESITSGIVPPRGSVFAGEKAVCASCSRIKEEKKFRGFYRPYEIDPDSGRCLLEQGILCQGLATREGCGGLCTAVGAACRGCFGKAEAVFDPGAKMVSAVSSTFDSTEASEIEGLTKTFVDLAGTFYRYTLATQCALRTPNAEEAKHAPDNS